MRHYAGGIATGWRAHLNLLMDLPEGRSPRDFRPHHAALENDYAREMAAVTVRTASQ